MKLKLKGRRFLRSFFAVIFFLSFSAAFSACAEQTVIIKVPPVVQFEGKACTLSEIADISASGRLKSAFGALILSVEGGVISRSQVVDALGVSGIEGVTVELHMPNEVIVRGLNEPVELNAEKKEQLSLDDKDGKAAAKRLASMIKLLAAWDGDVSVSYASSVPEGRLISPASVVPGVPSATLRFLGDDGKERSIVVRLTWTQDVLVMARTVQKGHVLSEADLILRSQRIQKPGVYASEPSQAIGRSLRKTLKQGEPVPLSLIEAAQIVKIGKPVTIIARGGGVTVTTKGVLLNGGAVGEKVRVRRLDNKVILTAVVLKENTLGVDIG